MPDGVTDFWAGLTGGTKALLALIALVGVVTSFAAATNDFRLLPEKVESLEVDVERNTSELRRLQIDSDALSAFAERILCYLEAQAEERPAVGCSR